MIPYTELDYTTIKFKKHKLRNRDEYVCSIPFAVDIECTTLFVKDGKWKAYDDRYPKLPENYYIDCEKYAFCYIWQFGFMQQNAPQVYYGRTLEEFYTFITSMQKALDCDLIIYAHNLSYEMQFFRNIFDDINVFARKPRKPIKFDCFNNHITFKCSYMLANMSLDTIGKNITKSKKLTGTYDYTKVRFPDTQLTDDELAYCEYDIIVLLEYLDIETSEVNNRLEYVPLTGTGKTRKLIGKECGQKDYVNYCQRCVPDLDMFKIMLMTFTGATTHTNPLYTDFVCNDVHCKDLTSSYPTIALAYELPYSKFYHFNATDNPDLISDRYCWMAKLTMTNVKSKLCMNYISCSKCVRISKFVGDNGKLYSADYIEIYITSVDWDIIKDCYDYTSATVSDVIVATKGYLDNRFRAAILKMYEKKTLLKNEVKYMESNGYSREDIYFKQDELRQVKGRFNALYGCMVTNVVGQEIGYSDDDWTVSELTDESMTEQLIRQTYNRKQYFVYAHGVFVTAWARYRLWKEALIPLNRDIVYTDTDSCKYFNDHEEHFNLMNEQLKHRLLNCGLPEELLPKLCPKDVKGIPQWIGIWDDEGTCDLISQGAKKYATIKHGELTITVAGLSKKLGINNPQLKTLDDFRVGLKFETECSGRMIAYYLDDMQPVDINGHFFDYKFGIAIQPTTYTLGRGSEYDMFLQTLNYEREVVTKWMKN